MKFVLVVATSFLLFSCRAKVGQSNEDIKAKHSSSDPMTQQNLVLDTVIRKSFPLTLEGDTGILCYHLSVTDWYKPVKWQVTISIDSSILFADSSIDIRIDPFFADTGYVAGCRGYIPCKQEWYLSGIWKIPVDTISEKDEHRIHYEQEGEGISADSESYPIKLDTNVIHGFWRDYKLKKILTFSFCDNPATEGTTWLAYYPKLRKLIPICYPEE